MMKMVRPANDYVCQNCGAVHAKWGGCCDDCGGWNTIVEETRQAVSIFGSMIIDDFKCVSGRG